MLKPYTAALPLVGIKDASGSNNDFFFKDASLFIKSGGSWFQLNASIKTWG